MSTAARIEELRKKFDENPRRYFAPLANELRKAGELKQAIALCRDHLPKQPGHMSGYIVFGQALFEVGELDEARSVFEQALALDPENLIALHHLGHIARQQDDIAAARRWYERALETDPRNDNIAHHLAGLAAPVQRDLSAIPTPPAAPVATGAISTPPEAPAAISELPLPLDEAPIDLTFDVPADVVIDDLVDEDVVVEAAAAPVPAEDPFVFAVDDSTMTVMDAAGASAPIDLDAAFEEGLVAAGWPDATELAVVATPRVVTPLSVEVPPDAVEAFGREAGDPVALPLLTPEVDVLGDEADLVTVTPMEATLETAVPAEVSFSDLLPVSVVGDEGEGTEPMLAAAFDGEDVEPIAGILEAPGGTDLEVEAAHEKTWQEVEPADEASAQSPAFVTETMGELLVTQGFVDRAVTVYEALVRRRPYDPVLSARLAELREQVAAATPVHVYTARERYAALAGRRVVRRTPVRAYTPVGSAAVSPRAVTPVSAAAIVADESLASLFGAESPLHDDSAARTLADAFAPHPLDNDPADGFTTAFLGVPDGPRTPTPAYGAVRQPTPIAVPPVPPGRAEVGDEFSFDRFFPDPAVQAGSSAAGGAVPNSTATPPVGGSTPVESSPSDDLAEFSAWLKGLGQP
jgi:hypothetical protein